MREKNHLVKPFLKWAGGKRQLAEQIVPSIPSNFRTYYEPFIGAGAILFNKQPKKAIINDLNEQLCNTYEVIRDNVEELIVMLQNHIRENKDDGAKYFYQMREADRDSTKFNNMSKVEKAARIIYLNKTCYNGLYRVNSSGLFNTPYGYYSNPAICESDVLRAIHNYFNSSEITILNGDFATAVEDAEKGDFVYFDPPYDSPNCTNFTGYQAGGFDHK
ncbi:MAG: DNA adenine methylase, partial [Candidatus Cloacimonetes bacterium]|nr:DNA adenine methylase [Candidatus Cloacimonadota bacterium]